MLYSSSNKCGTT